MSGSETSEVTQPGESSYFCDQLVGISSDTLTFEDTKPLIDEILQFLGEAKDYGTRDVADAFRALYRIPRCIMHEDLDANLDSIDTTQYYKVVFEVGQYLLHQDFSTISMRISNALHQMLSGCTANSDYGAQCQYNCSKLYGVIQDHSSSLNPASFCRSIIEEGIQLEVLLKMLEYFNAPDNDTTVFIYYGNTRVNLTQSNRRDVLLILLNCIKACPDLRKAYREANIVKILLNVKGDFQMKILILLTLSYVVDDNQSDMLRKSDDSIHFLTNLFKKSVESKHHYVRDLDEGPALLYSAFELLDGLNHLSVNDANKLDILKHGGVPAIIRMLQPDFTDDERKLATEALWNLAFVDQIKSTGAEREIK